ncbi:MAG: DNA-binding protein [Gammaproteobacteria bacterium CG11_big_fil_rev_8_21_14_0_20_46_22]|nr:MAG: DNA-binding protein [Gammaproteobacteria bacterium CG12_big_fil_rev_8_21_14_0_65_46_12]PIR11763.1 MAG: DNA-binding protein [Gammaproteobacteria bacterium CG11_big_fil_rev_8_21_14_0_20_46_22]
MNEKNQSRALNEKAAAQYIGMSVSYLRKDRMDGLVGQRTPGPRYAKLGKRVIYLRDDLDAWLEQHLVQRRLDG